MVLRLFLLHHVRVLHVAVRAGNDGNRQWGTKHSMAVHRHIRSHDAGNTDLRLGCIKVSEKNVPAVGLLFFYRKHLDLFRRIYLRAK